MNKKATEPEIAIGKENKWNNKSLCLTEKCGLKSKNNWANIACDLIIKRSKDNVCH